MGKMSRFLIIAVVIITLLASACQIVGPISGESETTKAPPQTETTQSELKQERPVKILWRNSRELDDEIGAETKQFIEESSGVKFEVVRVVAYDEFDQRIGIAIASQEDIDMLMLRNISTYTDLSSRGSLMKLNELLEEHAPNLLNLFSKEEWKATTYKNGNIYGIPRTDIRRGDIISVRKDWMEKLGMSSIDTIEDLETFLKGIKDSDFDGNGEKDTCTLISGSKFAPLDTCLAYLFIEVFPHSPNGVYIDSNGIVTPSALHPGYKDYLKKMSEWYKDGLIYQDSYIIKSAQIEDLIIANKASALANWYSSHIRPWDTLKQTVPEAEYVPVAPKTVKGNPYALIAPAPGNPHIGIVSYTDNAVFALKLLDWIAASKDNYFTTKQGMMGKDWEWADDNKQTYKDLKNDPQSNTRYWFHYGFLNYVEWDAKANNPTFLNAQTYASEAYQKELDYVFKPDWFVSYNWRGTTVENSLEDAKTLINETSDKIILGLLPLDEWDKAIAEYKKLYADEFIRLATETYNEYGK